VHPGNCALYNSGTLSAGSTPIPYRHGVGVAKDYDGPASGFKRRLTRVAGTEQALKELGPPVSVAESSATPKSPRTGVKGCHTR
jgi:hypothetical protein